MRTHTATQQPVERTVADRLAEWVASGLVSDSQAEAIRQHESEAGRSFEAGTRAGPSLVVEALGYLGALVMVVGAGILVGTSWSNLPVPGPLLLLGGAAALLIGTGFVVLRRPGAAAGRLRTVLWAAGVAATAGFMIVLSDDVLGLHDEDQVWLVGAVTALVGGTLWAVRRTEVQLLGFFVPVVLTTVGVALQLSEDENWPARATWVVGVLWAAASWVSWIKPRVAGVAYGAIAAVFGALSMRGDLGVALGVATAASVVGLSLLERDRVWLAVGALTLFFSIPRAAEAWFPGARSAALTFMLVGALLVAAAAWVARSGPRKGRDRSTG
jgi:hypothetical protein